MKYFDSNINNHKLVFISREEVDNANVILYDKWLNETTTIENLDVYCLNGYLTLNFYYQFTKDKTYLLKIESDHKILFQDLCKTI
jgi:hypothetical protein